MIAMPKKTILIGDPGIDTAFALALALLHPDLDVVAVAATAGNVTADQATENLHNLVEHFDPPKLPRIGHALPVDFEPFGKTACGVNGLGGASLSPVRKLRGMLGDKIIVEECKKHHHEITVALLGPATVLARALERDPDLPIHLKGIILVGGVWREPGDAGPVSEWHLAADPHSARKVLRCGAPITLVPLDVARRLTFSPAELDELLAADSAACNLLRRIVPGGLRASAEHCGIEGLVLPDLAGVAFLLWPQHFTTRPTAIDVETRGELTRGMCVIESRPGKKAPNLDMAIDADVISLKAELHKAFHGFSA
jgi:inosine-uridine nucleoside N-ribohydrolase